jgi:hypothetical protein
VAWIDLKVLPTVFAIIGFIGGQAASGQDCPTAQTAPRGFVVERGERSKTEVFRDGTTVRTMLRYAGNMILETTLFEGLFQLDRIDRGRRTVFKPKTELAAVFPLKPGQRATVEFESRESTAPATTRTVVLAVKDADDLYIGPCKYSVLRIERTETRGDGRLQVANTDYYSSDLKLIIAKEWKDRDGKTTLVKFDRIYPIKH